MATHESHPEIIKRLKRAEGHLRSIIGMMEENRSCLEVAQQLQAVEGAITNAKKTLVKDHVDHCLEHVVNSGEKTSEDALKEFKEIIRYL
jgi:hypothetical protein NreA